ncbi:increased DNA methylation 1-like [Prosopis cineraria]|uniref:increased DNA methylation 1-like n=1 Tax=Prosopis cineraria TaxID=364024 RepID=UPI00240F841B|nr:increased DNA methylation 1-like [Prosopis cineraria]
MKQDSRLLSVWEGQSHDAFVPTSASEAQSGSHFQTMLDAQVSGNGSSSMVGGAVVNGYIVYTRQRKARRLCDGSSENEKFKRLKTSVEPQTNAHIPGMEGGGGVEVDNVEHRIEIGVSCNVEKPKSYNELENEPRQDRAGEGGFNGVSVVMSNGDGVQKDAGVKTLKRYSRSALKTKVRSSGKAGSVSESSQAENTKSDGKVNAAPIALTAPRNKLELKMSKKIVLNKKPMTVKELFDTGLLDGVPVVYMGGKKASGLRGIIKDGGILCSCCLCNGRKVIPPSQFEIHACKAYKRAAQYICLENGKSLLELLRACRGAPLHTLEATIQSVVCSPPDEKYFTCKMCKVCFPPSCVERVGSICSSCKETKESQDSSIDKVGKRVRSPRALSVSKQSDISEKRISSQIKRHWKKRTKSPKWVSRAKSSKNSSVTILSRKKSLWKMKKKSSKLSVKLKTARTTSNSMPSSSPNKSHWRITKKHQQLHKLVFEEGGLPDGAEVAYYARGQKLLEGYKKGFGIMCRCCNSEVSPSQFEVHAGWASRKKPYAYIYTSNGVSLHELAISLSKDRKYSAKDNDDLCIICWDGGDLLLCDGCPRAFHKECASLLSIPRGNWYCKFCQNMFQRERFVAHNVNAVAAGRVEGVDPIEQITKRCVRIVEDVDTELNGCALCRACDFSKSGFGPRTIIICDQCDKEFHVGCLRDHKMSFLKELPEGDWFCCHDCSTIHSTFQNLLVGGAEKLPEPLLDVIKKKQEEKGLESLSDIDVKWRLLRGKIASPETRPFLLQAVSIFHECFDPIVDSITGRNLITAMIYGRTVRRQEFGAMHCAILMVNSTVVSAALLRIFGSDFAELPLVATRSVNHGKGYFQMLYSCIEKLLTSLNVKNLVLPATATAESIWIEKFGFTKMTADELSNYRKNYQQMVIFQGTSMLHKMIAPCPDIKNSS